MSVNKHLRKDSKHTSDGIVKGLLREVARLIRRVEDLVVEHGEVQSETKADRVGRGQLGCGNLARGLVGLERLVGRVLALVARSEFGQVAVVVTLPIAVLVTKSLVDLKYSHLVVEDLGLAALGRLDKMIVQDFEDILADIRQLLLDLLTILLDKRNVRLVALGLLLLLDRGDDAPRRAARPNHILVRHGEEVTLFDG